ncbi:MAG: hypothetical protein RR280_01145 [Bacteroidaceae bacterium]
MKFVPHTLPVSEITRTTLALVNKQYFQTSENRSIVVRDFDATVVVTSTPILKKEGVEVLASDFETMLCTYKVDVPQVTGSRDFVPAGEILLIHYLDSVLGCKMPQGCILYSTPEGSFASDRYWKR